MKHVNFNNKVFTSEQLHSHPNSLKFHFQQSGPVITGSYHSDEITKGFIVGKISGSCLIVRYAELSKDHTLNSGIELFEIELKSNGKLALSKKVFDINATDQNSFILIEN